MRNNFTTAITTTSRPTLTSRSHLKTYKHLVFAGEDNISVSGGDGLGLVAVSSFNVSCVMSIPVSAYWHYQPHCIYRLCYQHLLDRCRLVPLAVSATLSVFCQWPPVAIGPTFRNFRGVFHKLLSTKCKTSLFSIHVLLGYLPPVIAA